MNDATAPDSPGRRSILAAIETAPDRVTGSGTLEGVTYSQDLWACPVQIVGMADGVPFYFRYRWGWLHVGFGGDPIQDAEWTFGRTIGDWLDGSMTGVETEEWLATAVAAWREVRDG